MTGGNPIGRGFPATPDPENSSIYGVRFTHPILQSVTLFSRFKVDDIFTGRRSGLVSLFASWPGKE